MFIVGCNPQVEETFTPFTPVPTAVTAELPEGVKIARDAAIAYVNINYDIWPRISEADWKVACVTPEDIVGASAYRLTADSCVITVSYPVTAPDSTIYHVVLDDSAVNFHWEGDVDAQGQVLPQWLSVDDLAASSAPSSINLVILADLHSTVGIEVCQLDCASYTPFYTIGNPEHIAALIDALDTDMPLRPHARCPATYQLRFILADGQHYDFGYTCQMMTPTFLRGNQDFWMGQDAVAPDAFNELMLPFIAPATLNDTVGQAGF
jgi:hypothetical protein